MSNRPKPRMVLVPLVEPKPSAYRELVERLRETPDPVRVLTTVDLHGGEVTVRAIRPGDDLDYERRLDELFVEARGE